MPIIYEPKGKAKEYADLAVNIYRGCAHGCKYCYAPNATRNDRSQFHNADFIRVLKKFDLKQLEKEAAKLQGTQGKVLISFTSDPYQPIDVEQQLTRRVIEILGENEIPFTVLTKAGRVAERDFDLLKQYGGEFGTSLVWSYATDSKNWEPNAAYPANRIRAIVNAKELGIRTWVSLEPVIDPSQALEVIKVCHRYVDHWKVGKINHHPDIEKAVDWRKFCQNLRHYQIRYSLDLYVKDSLKPYWEAR